MYEVKFRSGAVKNKLAKLFDSMRGDKVTFRKALEAFESLRHAPRAYKPGNKHILHGDRRGVWALSLTPRMRLLYTINDGELIVTAVEVSDHYK